MTNRIWTALLLALVLTALVPSSGWAQNKPNPPKKDPAADQDRQTLLTTVGLLTAGQLYQTYLNIGFLADGKAEGTYEEKEAREILASVVNLLDTLDRQLEKVSKLELGKEDRAALEHLQKIAGLVRTQGKELDAFWASNGDKARGERYEKARKEAWEAVSKLLGLEK